MILPGPLYELLPALYAAFGTLAIRNVDPMFGKIADGLLITAAVVIHRMRRRNRQG